MVEAAKDRKLTEEELFFYEDQICAEAEILLHYCTGLTLNQEAGVKALFSCYGKAAAQIRNLRNLSGLDMRAALVGIVMQDAQPNVKANADSPIFAKLAELSRDDRAIFLARDVLGLPIATIASTFGKTDAEVLNTSAATRKSMRKLATI